MSTQHLWNNVLLIGELIRTLDININEFHPVMFKI